jgi:hypothetical protein
MLPVLTPNSYYYYFALAVMLPKAKDMLKSLQ